MADNYLERRMDDLRAGRLGADNRRLAAARRRLTAPCVTVIGGASPLGEATVRRLRSEGATVDFLDTDRREGTRIARDCGACFHPLDSLDPAAVAAELDAILRKRRRIDLIAGRLPSLK